jgi:hypothetical protein
MRRSCFVVAFAAACGAPVEGLPDYCADRADDVDCDGVPDSRDQCPGTEIGALKDARGCTENQRAGCGVLLKTPLEDEKLDRDLSVAFRWSGDCDVYLVQVSNDPEVAPAATRTVARVPELQATADVEEAYWRVVGAREDKSAGYATPARRLSWR